MLCVILSPSALWIVWFNRVQRFWNKLTVFLQTLHSQNRFVKGWKIILNNRVVLSAVWQWIKLLQQAIPNLWATHTHTWKRIRMISRIWIQMTDRSSPECTRYPVTEVEGCWNNRSCGRKKAPSPLLPRSVTDKKHTQSLCFCVTRLKNQCFVVRSFITDLDEKCYMCVLQDIVCVCLCVSANRLQCNSCLWFMCICKPFSFLPQRSGN